MTKRTDIALGMGAALVIGAGAMGLLALRNDPHPASTAAHQTPTSLPTATTTIRLPGATTTITAPPLPRATITKTLPQATKTIVAPRKELICPGKTEDSCYPDYIGKGRWIIREGERPLPQATKKVPQATIFSVCSNPRITDSMVADCNKLAARPKTIDAQGNENPAGPILVAECIDSYDNATELRECLR